MLITIVYDNNAYNKAARVSSGFSCVVETSENTVLFDTGIHGPTLLYNFEQLGFKPRQIENIVISHSDPDHIGGLFNFLDENRHVRVFIPRSFPEAFKDLIALSGAKLIEICRRKEICPGIETTGEMGAWIKEQALIVRSEKGIIVIVGDSHCGVLNVIKRVKRQTRENVYLMIGGFSLNNDSVEYLNPIMKSFRRMGVKNIAPCHSIGENVPKILKRAYKDNYIRCGVGKVFEI